MTRQEGTAAPILIIAAAMLTLVLGGVSFELWHVLAEHSRITDLAEGAALSGATAIDVAAIYQGDDEPQLDPDEAVARVCRYLEAGNVSCGDALIRVQGASIEVKITARVALTLLRLTGTPDAYIDVEGTATAVALRSG